MNVTEKGEKRFQDWVNKNFKGGYNSVHESDIYKLRSLFWAGFAYGLKQKPKVNKSKRK